MKPWQKAVTGIKAMNKIRVFMILSLSRRLIDPLNPRLLPHIIAPLQRFYAIATTKSTEWLDPQNLPSVDTNTSCRVLYPVDALHDQRIPIVTPSVVHLALTFTWSL